MVVYTKGLVVLQGGPCPFTACEQEAKLCHFIFGKWNFQVVHWSDSPPRLAPSKNEDVRHVRR